MIDLDIVEFRLGSQGPTLPTPIKDQNSHQKVRKRKLLWNTEIDRGNGSSDLSPDLYLPFSKKRNRGLRISK